MVPWNKWLGPHMKYLCKISNQIPWTNYCKSLKFCVGFILRMCMNCFCKIKYQANVLPVQCNKRKICKINFQRNNIHGETWQNIIFAKCNAFTVNCYYDRKKFLSDCHVLSEERQLVQTLNNIYWNMTYNLVCLTTLDCAWLSRYAAPRITWLTRVISKCTTPGRLECYVVLHYEYAWRSLPLTLYVIRGLTTRKSMLTILVLCTKVCFKLLRPLLVLFSNSNSNSNTF